MGSGKQSKPSAQTCFVLEKMEELQKSLAEVMSTLKGFGEQLGSVEASVKTNNDDVTRLTKQIDDFGANVEYEEETSIARGEEQLDVEMDVKLDMELDMKISHGRARRSGRHAREEKKKSRPIVNQENKDSADIINWREFEALRNEMRREFRTKDDELKELDNTTTTTTKMMKILSLKMTHTMLVVRLVVIVLVAGFHLAAMVVDKMKKMDWLKIEKLWSLHPHYSEDRKIKLASSEFDGYALRWWDSLVRNLDEDGAQPIRTWRAMKEAMTSRFVPTNYMRNIFDKLTLLRQGVKTVDEYYMEMEMLMQRGRVRESLEMTMQRFLNGLNWLKKQRLRDVLRELGVLHPRALYSAGAFDALRSLLYSA
ncbi:hypothetical protein QYE76_071144 [Lolium multiflorum]|uniref:Retrotransposon gag domain-containing protein n=1 Tax=Lolium multiflorum TaxID=4521 RepID=A0AAD8SKB1_LOLMU|nr:hypothetical protein QYE76_071144 [Lolium multiflorum]